MKGKEYLKNREVVADMRKKLLEQQVILTDCYYWKDVYEALRLEKEEAKKKFKEMLADVDFELLLTDIKDKQGNKMELSDEIMQIISAWWDKKADEFYVKLND